MAWHVHKFGGTCLADAARIENVTRLVTGAPAGHTAVVVSAMAGVTNGLIHATELAAQQDEGYREALQALEQRTIETCNELLQDAAAVIDFVRSRVAELHEILRGVQLAGLCPPSTLELVSGFGEAWSAYMLQARLSQQGHDAVWLDAREVLIVDHDATGPTVCWAETEERFADWLQQHTATFVVITGFVARDPSGAATTLHRNGSDFSASIFGKLLAAESITIWTDVDGVMSADPREVPEAAVLAEMSYSEAMELAFFGAKVLHPQTMGPAVESGIPIHIRSAFNPDAPGTWIRETNDADTHLAPIAVKGLSSISGIALLSLEGAGMIGVPGVASRLFAALREVGISVTMISQASSEHSICVAIPAKQQERAQRAVTDAFAAELAHGHIQCVDISGPYSILAAVGDDMVKTPGVAARFFGALGRAGVNVRAIAQGSSERNISAVVTEAEAARALRSTHAGFYLAERTVSVGVVGPGLVGAELLQQLHTQHDSLREDLQIEVRVRGLANSRRMVLDDRGLDLAQWRHALEHDQQPLDLDAFAAHVQAPHLPHAVILDCTANEDIAGRYPEWLQRGIHVVTPNKQANTGPLQNYRTLRQLGDRLSTRYLYEATVGAGLPVISTLRDLIRTGDRVHKIEGVLSGTLSFLLGTFGPDMPFSAVVREARQRGYMEPDPRDDLSGMDVARKAVILGREIGLTLELSDVPVTSLVPQELADCAEPDRFIDELPRFDDDMEQRRRKAEEAGEVLRYGAVIETSGQGRVHVGLRPYPLSHPFAHIHPGDNILAFTTDRYDTQPLIVQGPGAGPAVTAAGVFGDLLRLVTSLGAPA